MYDVPRALAGDLALPGGATSCPGHGGGGKGSAFDAIVEGEGVDALGVGSFNAHRDRLAGSGDDGGVGEVSGGGAGVGNEGRVGCSGRAEELRSFKVESVWDAIEVEAGVEEVVAAEPTGTEGDLVFTSIDGGATAIEGCLDMVMHVLGGAGGVEVEDITAAIWIRNDRDVLVGAEGSPSVEVSGFEVAVADHGNSGGVGVFSNGKVIDEDFSFFEHSKDEFTPLRVWSNGAGSGGGAEGVGLPGGAGEFVAVGPGGGE